MRAELWIDEVIGAGTPVSARAEHPLRWVIADVLDEMEPRFSEPLRMWAWENMSYAAIARELGLAGRQSAHERVKAALAVFKDRMEELVHEAATQQRNA
jgi:DNA-directed RNA polymerase specialized sigma24 family protein